MTDFDKQAVKVFKALAGPIRYKIVKMLAQKGELSCGDFESVFKLSRPAMSHHYRILENSGLVKTRKEGSHIFISLDKELLESVVPKFFETHR